MSERGEAAMQRISVCILTFNDADTIEGAVSSVRWADEIVVVDNASSDRTVEVAQGLGVRVEQVSVSGFGELRQRAADACRYEWVLSLDADERCTPELRDEILALLGSGPAHDAYLVPRRNFMMGRWIRGSGWYPDYRGLQLFRKGAMRYTLDPIHEDYELVGNAQPGKLQNSVWHFPFRDFDEILTKVNVFSSQGAKKLADRKVSVSMWSALGRGTWAFLRHYVFKAGFRDGWAGFVIALSNFEGTFYRYAKKYEEMQGWVAPSAGTVTRENNREVGDNPP
jgi:glycosyltransferase involved in cell wall biosynthesis